MMLEQLTLINFQKHHKLVIEFDPFITSVCGRTDSGKSSIIRMLRWILLNQPRGDEFISWGKDKCIGKLILDDGRLIVRRTGAGGNLYKLDGAVYRAFGSDVPSDIASLLNVSDINFQQQLDGPFWLTESPGQVSRQLNAIINLGVIDSTLSNVASEVRKAKATVEVSEERLRIARQTRDSLAWVPSMHKKLSAITELQNTIAEKRLKRSRINDLYSRGKILKRSIRESSRGISDVTNVLAMEEKLTALTERREKLDNLIQKIEKTKRAARVEIPNLSPLILQLQELESLQERRQKLDALISTIEQQQEQSCLLRERYKQFRLKFQQRLGDTCPLCNQPLKSNPVK